MPFGKKDIKDRTQMRATRSSERAMLRRGGWQSEGHIAQYGTSYKTTKYISWWSATRDFRKEVQGAATPEYDM